MLENMQNTIQSKFEPQPDHMDDTVEKYQINQQKLAFWVGLTAILLPIILFASWLLFAVPFRDSISHHYYSGWTGGIFVIALAFIGTFMVAYRGRSKMEEYISTIGGWCAFGVAMFPTSGMGFSITDTKVRIFADIITDPQKKPIEFSHDTIDKAFQLAGFSSIAHFTFAAVLFLILAFFCFFIFTQKVEGVNTHNGVMTKVKSRRNSIYILSGWIILISIAAIASKEMNIWGTFWNDCNLTFWFEAFALWAFGSAWMVRGRFWGKWLKDN